ncbi:uncharacterized protein LOC143044665 [Mytilus galloprovincialis]|uniref:uncharacterized protein LOC143044665 n=1 Tax=Mytilus galloprovincialis TaxID=29158 RepID=UPI003F7B4E08
MEDSTFKFVKLFFVILSFSKKSHGLTFEKRLCENSTAEITCPDGNAIENIDIMFHNIGNACSLTNDGYMGTAAMNSTSYSSCIGHNSCVLSNKMVNVSHLVADKTWKLNIDYHCIRSNFNKSKPQKTVCPYNMETVKCGNPINKIEIQSVKVMYYSSFCKERNMHQQCTESIHQKVQESCNITNTCRPIIWTKSVNTWDDCIRIPKFVNISFSCKAIPPNIPLLDETNLVSVAVVVTVGLITIVGVIVVYIWFLKRKVTDDKQKITNQRDENKYIIGNDNTTGLADSNYEMLTTDQESRSYDELNQDFRKQSSRDQSDRNINKDIENEYIIPYPVNQNNKYKHKNENQTVNHVESNIGTGIGEQVRSSLSNSADYFIVLESNGTDHFEHHLNSNVYEMANHVNENDLNNEENKSVIKTLYSIKTN